MKSELMASVKKAKKAAGKSSRKNSVKVKSGSAGGSKVMSRKKMIALSEQRKGGQ